MNREEAIEIVRGSGLAEHAEALIASMRPSVRIRVEGGQEPDGDGSFFGGVPRLPVGAAWPRWDNRELLAANIARLEQRLKERPGATALRDMAARARAEMPSGPVPLMFLGQLDLGQMASVGGALEGWPGEGSLAFFGHQEAAGFDPKERGACVVLYMPASQRLEPVVPPDDLDESCRFPRRGVRFTREWTLPDSMELGGEEHYNFEDGPYTELCESLMDCKRQSHRCGGHAQPVQGGMELECQLVTNGLYCGDTTGYKDPRRAALEPGAAEWRLLLQIDSDDELDWMWGDLGRMYFWIRQGDLESRVFEACWLIMQCG